MQGGRSEKPPDRNAASAAKSLDRNHRFVKMVSPAGFEPATY